MYSKDGFEFHPDLIPPDLALRRYLVGGYAYEHIPGKTCMSDAEWDRLAKRVKRSWWRIHHPHKKILDRHFLRSIAHVPEYKFPLIVVSCAYHRCGLSFPNELMDHPFRLALFDRRHFCLE